MVAAVCSGGPFRLLVAVSPFAHSAGLGAVARFRMGSDRPALYSCSLSAPQGQGIHPQSPRAEAIGGFTARPQTLASYFMSHLLSLAVLFLRPCAPLLVGRCGGDHLFASRVRIRAKVGFIIEEYISFEVSSLAFSSLRGGAFRAAYYRAGHEVLQRYQCFPYTKHVNIAVATTKW
jgi:hypothetical protein